MAICNQRRVRNSTLKNDVILNVLLLIFQKLLCGRIEVVGNENIVMDIFENNNVAYWNKANEKLPNNNSKLVDLRSRGRIVCHLPYTRICTSHLECIYSIVMTVSKLTSRVAQPTSPNAFYT